MFNMKASISSIHNRRLLQQEFSETSDISRRRAPSPASRVVVMKKGLDPSTISALPLVSYKRSAKQGNIEDCIICLSEFEEGEMVKLIPKCKHVFHNYCIDTWLESHVSCPLCRSTAEDGDTSQEVVGSNEIRR
ncbi:ubiquitin-protein ligase [Lithospermum erythrorhizon]|uniref:RING-type E3 ubiquitin transferase n=1 Tax=Lithospermum erythrorhizon TaxID=34254 RepID=A0AAV3Q6N6_LITER